MFSKIMKLMCKGLMQSCLLLDHPTIFTLITKFSYVTEYNETKTREFMISLENHPKDSNRLDLKSVILLRSQRTCDFYCFEVSKYKLQLFQFRLWNLDTLKNTQDQSIKFAC